MKCILFCFFCLSVNVLPAQYTIEGFVTNALGEQLEGASVFLVDTEFAAATDREGHYMISGIPEGDYILQCSYVGYESKILSLEITSDEQVDLQLSGTVYNLESIEITANQLDDRAPFSYQVMDREDIALREATQDLPFLLRHTPSMVVTSDAGAGVGYTGMRIRGSDPTRINVTINGVPLNDAESHGVFWVDLPDFSNSVDDIQLQRGVGPSTNGAGAFGATIALNSDRVYQNPFIDINAAYGSFNTNKLSFQVNTGLIDGTYQIEGRYSRINSDGYIDRASSDLDSWYFSAAKVNDRSSLRLNVFSGKERTYQSWWGTPEAKLDEDVSLLDHYYNNLGVIYNTPADSINLFDSGRSYNYYTYGDQVDDYRQTHYQLMYGVQVSDNFTVNTTAHYTRGLGFFEEFRYQDDLREYGLTEMPFITDLVRRRWLDNHYYGLIINTEYVMSPAVIWTLGGSYSEYKGDHYGQVIFAEEFEIENPEERYYENMGDKRDANGYIRASLKAAEGLDLFADLQLRHIRYDAEGLDNGNVPILIDTSYLFFNPKFGATFTMNDKWQMYGSYAVAQREPVRSDFTDALGTAVPDSEKLHDFELGVRFRQGDLRWSVNGYYMLYDNQLVLTGAVNDVGAPVRQNVTDSYRAGMEAILDWSWHDQWHWQYNIALSRNRIKSFEESIIDYGTGDIVINEFEDTPIAFSPSVVTGSTMSYRPVDDVTVSWLAKYVGRQYLDNTGNDARSIDPYFVNDLIVSYAPATDYFEHVILKLMVNNVLDTKYSANGYTYSYIFGDLITENFYYPQAGIHYVLSLNVRF